LQDRLSASDIRDTRIPDGGTPGWNILNCTIGYTWKWISINAGIHNIFNKAYRTHGSGMHGYGRCYQFIIRFEPTTRTGA
ncbi:MAG TPA: TonB-dependent receptor, partial [Bacteroidales bacterium]|nr:TonB-dependent receptor [Bacteroidales bacterium]